MIGGKMNTKFTKKQIEEMLKNSTEEVVSGDEFIIDEHGNKYNVNIVIKKAEDYAKKKYPKVNFRWSEFEIIRAKKIASKLGIKYQTYIKSLLKQGMDYDEKRLQQM